MNFFVLADGLQHGFNAFMAENGWQVVGTTFVSDFALCEPFGASAVKDTFKRVTDGWLNDYKMYTECVQSLNYLCWYYYEIHNAEFQELYADLYYKALHNVETKYKDDSEILDYIFRATD